MKLRNALLVATILAAPVAVKAQPVTGLYVGAGAGYNYLQETKVKSLGVGPFAVPTNGAKIRDDGGFLTTLSVGYGLGNGLRLEVEGNYRNEHFRFKDGSGTRGQGGGNFLEYGGAFNALYDFYFGSPFMPYVGVGVGYGESQLQNAKFQTPGSTSSINFNNNAKGSVTAQAILGVSYTVPALPNLAFTAEYRFHDAFNSERFKGVGSVGGLTAPASGKIDSQYNHALMLGIRYAFNAAAPAAPPPAPLPPVQSTVARTYLVFFDWDRSDLTARARQIIAEAAQASTKVQTTRIEVNGYTDLSGTARYNEGLSIRRANAVAAELVRDGVPRSAIVAKGFGESNPLVPTAKGVREPQNRRVEIILK